MATYDFTLVNHTGKDNSAPDTLSCLLLPSTGDALTDGCTDCLISQICPHWISFAEVQQCMTADPLLWSMHHHIDTYWPNKSAISAELQSYFHVYSELEHSNGVVLHDGCIVLPATLQQKVLMMTHAGHPGMV